MINPYKLPEGNVQICFSGGRTSAYLLFHILKNNSADDLKRVQVIFTNTGREFNETLDFVQRCSSEWGVKVVWLEYTRLPVVNEKAVEKYIQDKFCYEHFLNYPAPVWLTKPYFEIVSHNQAAVNGQPFSKMIRAKKYLPNVATRFCTIELKIRTAKRYLLTQGWEKWVNALGIRFDEPQRIKPDQPKERWNNWYPLNDAKVTRRDVQSFWDNMPFDLGLKGYDGKTPLGNCDGCFLKSEANRAALARDYPERYQWWIEAEAEASAIAKQSTSQFRRDYKYSDLSNFVTRQGSLFDEGQACQKSEGECTG